MNKGGPGYVYAIQPVGMDVVKIGTTTTPKTRAWALSAYSPVPLVFRHLLQVETKRVGCVFEADLLGWSDASTGWGEWRNDLALIDDLFACIAPAVCVRDDFKIERGQIKSGSRLSPDDLYGRADVAAYRDLAPGHHWNIDAAIGLTNQPTTKHYSAARNMLNVLRVASLSEAS